jgi:hypothetical protein
MMLEGVYAGFNEGFGTQDLQAAKLLLDTFVGSGERR